MKRDRRELLISMRELAGASDAWGTDFGANVFHQLNVRLLAAGEGTLIPLDYSGLERSDVSFQREAVVETLRKHRPRLLFIATHLVDPDLRENLSLALERRDEYLLVREPGKRPPSVLGPRLADEHQSTLEKVWQHGEVASSDLTAGLKLSTASNRLVWLWRAGLIERIEGTAATGGREHRYFAIG